MIVKNVNEGAKGFFAAMEDEEEAGRMTYTPDHRDHEQISQGKTISGF